MPQKICELKSLLRRYGFVERSGKGNHTVCGGILNAATSALHYPTMMVKMPSHIKKKKFNLPSRNSEKQDNDTTSLFHAHTLV